MTDSAGELQPLAQVWRGSGKWALLLANFPKSGTARAKGLMAAQEKGTLSKKLRAQAAWIAARHDRAWYALGRARLRLHDLGFSESLW